MVRELLGLARGTNSVWCRPDPGKPWCLQLMLAESDNHNWVFHRNLAILRPLEADGRRGADGVSYLAPTIRLLFKAKKSVPKTSTKSMPQSPRCPVPNEHSY